MARRFGARDSEEEPYELTPIEPACSICGYDLRGTTTATGARCPECGSELSFDKLKFRPDPAKERRFRRPRPIRDWLPLTWWTSTAIEVGIALCGLLFYVLTIAIPRRFGRGFFLVVLIVAALILAHALFVAYRRWQLRLCERDRKKRQRPRRSIDG